MRGATAGQRHEQPPGIHFNPRAPCGARQNHAFQVRCSVLFQSTRPVRGATGKFAECVYRGYISIHAPRAGRDHAATAEEFAQEISIHAPRAGRDGRKVGDGHNMRISIHAPRAGRDIEPSRLPGAGIISIHAPRAGRDDYPDPPNQSRSDFNPRAPCGARQPGVRKSCLKSPNFNPRAPCGARQPQPDAQADPQNISIHAPRAGRDEIPLSETS